MQLGGKNNRQSPTTSGTLAYKLILEQGLDDLHNDPDLRRPVMGWSTAHPQSMINGINLKLKPHYHLLGLSQINDIPNTWTRGRMRFWTSAAIDNLMKCFFKCFSLLVGQNSTTLVQYPGSQTDQVPCEGRLSCQHWLEMWLAKIYGQPFAHRISLGYETCRP